MSPRVRERRSGRHHPRLQRREGGRQHIAKVGAQLLNRTAGTRRLDRERAMRTARRRERRRSESGERSLGDGELLATGEPPGRSACG
jgi:hypothetical protein